MSRVERYETWVVRVPYGSGRSGTHVVLRLSTSDGQHGVGYVSNLTPWALSAQHAAVRALADRVTGQPVDDPVPLPATGSRPQLAGLARSAASVVDTALWDLRAQAAGVPLHRLLGATATEVDTYASWDLWWQLDVDTLVRNACRHVEQGFTAMKFRLGGITDVTAAVARTRALREAVGPDVDLLVDANWAWTVDQAVELGRALAPFGLRWLEDPLPADDVDGLRQIAAAVPVPLCAGETYHAPHQFRELLDTRAVGTVMIDLEVGGVTEWLRIAEIAAGYDVPVASHTCTEVSAHVVAAAGNATAVEYVPWARALFTDPLPLRAGRLALPDRPGLGLELDDAALRRYAI